MSADTEQAAAEAPPVIERGRYAVYEMPDGSWGIRRAGPICERCESCGCGEQAEPIMVPPMVVGLVTGRTSLPGPAQAILGKVLGNGK